MACEYKDQLLSTQQALAKQIQEQAGCNNPKHLTALLATMKEINVSLKDVVDREGHGNKVFDIVSQATA